MIDYNEIVKFGKGFQDAASVSSKEVAKSVEQLTNLYLGLAGKSIDSMTGAAKQIATCKSPTEVISLQQKLAKESFESLQADGKKIAELTQGMVKSSVEPFAAQYKSAFEVATKAAA